MATNDRKKWPTELKGGDLLVIGKSNVGKSTFINIFGKNKKLAKVSKIPGKTKTLVFFNVNKKFYLVDVPGYGYAKISDDKKLMFFRMMDEYFIFRENLKLIILLIDIRRGPNSDDLLIYHELIALNYDVLIIATKDDKVNMFERTQGIKKISNILDIDSSKIIEYSSKNKKNLKKLEKIINSKMN